MIPKLFYQTFETRDLVPGMGEARQTWLSMNPDWTAIFHDAEQRREAVRDHGADVLEAYDALDGGAFKADLWRYCMLYQTGGAYADIDSVCLAPLDSFVRADDAFVAARATPRANGSLGWVVANGLLAAQAGHAILERVIGRAVREVLAGEKDGFQSTGPSGLGMAINLHLGRATKSDLSHGDYDDFRLLRKEGLQVFDGDRPVFLAEYDGYKSDLESIGIQHWRETEKTPNLFDRLRRAARSVLYDRPSR